MNICVKVFFKFPLFSPF